MNYDGQWNMVARDDVSFAQVDVTFTTASGADEVKIPSGTRVRTADGREMRVYKRTWWRAAIWAVRDRLRLAWKHAKFWMLWAVVTPVNSFCRWRWPDPQPFTFWPNRRRPWFIRASFNEPRLFLVHASHFRLTIHITERMHISLALGPDSTAPKQPSAKPPDTAIALLERAENPSANQPPRV